jgi:undecaprenyl-diphosphatase
MASSTAILLGWLSGEVLEGDTSRFDAYVRAAVHGAATPAATAAMWFFTDLGSAAALAALWIAAVTIFWIFGCRREAVILTVTMAGSIVLVEALKLGFHRPRPTPYFGISAPHSFSYPSGHALLSFAFFATIAALSTVHTARVWARVLVWAAAAAIIGLIGYSRIYLGVHYPTDVIAGYLTAFIWVLLTSLASRVSWRRDHSSIK